MTRTESNKVRAELDAPPDITATEIAEVAREALASCVPSARLTPLWLGFLATCIATMRARGWTVLPPGHHDPIDPR